MIRHHRHFRHVAVIRLLCILSVGMLFSCTAYFNTIYNAEKAFREGQVSHRKILRNFPDSIVVTPPADASGKYDRAVEKAAKALETFPKAKKWHDDALFIMGKSYFYKKEMLKAIRRLRQLEQEFPASPLIPESYVYLGKAYIEEGNLDKAEEVLSSATERWPYLNTERQITLLLIAIAIKRNGKSQAIGLLEETARAVHSENLRTDLTIRMAELYIELKQYRKAIILLKSTPRPKQFPFQSYRMDRALFTCYSEIDSLQAASDLVDFMIAQKLYSEHLDEMLFQKGCLLHAMGKTDEAIKIFRKLTAGLDTSSVAGDTSNFKGRALYELGLIYQKDKKDYKKAHSYLKLASMARDTAAGRASLKILSAMDELNRLRGESDKKDSVMYRRLFSIGELFRFELNEPDSAFDQFMKICRDSFADTGLVPRALLQAAMVARDDLHDTPRSDSLFRRIIDRYPASEYAKMGQKELALPQTVKTRPDSAMDAYVEAEQLFYRQNDVKGAIRAFFEISRKYQELPIAPKSLFAAAWFSDNVLLKKKTARTLYEKICTKYPNSDYCSLQAKPRIKIVADTLEKLDRLRREKEKNQPVKKETSGALPAAAGRPGETVAPAGSDEQDLLGIEDAVPAAAESSGTAVKPSTEQTTHPDSAHVPPSDTTTSPVQSTPGLKNP